MTSMYFVGLGTGIASLIGITFGAPPAVVFATFVLGVGCGGYWLGYMAGARWCDEVSEQECGGE